MDSNLEDMRLVAYEPATEIADNFAGLLGYKDVRRGVAQIPKERFRGPGREEAELFNSH
jgi:hypothetical protein